MSKEEILENIDLDIQLDVKHMNTLMFMYRMNQIKELGLMSGGRVTITGTGFDIVHDVDKLGWKLSESEMLNMMSGLDDHFTPDMYEPIIAFITHLETVGYPAMKKELSELKFEEDA